MIFIIKLILFKKPKKTKKRGKPHSIEIKLLTNIWCSEVNMHINNLISILQFSRLGKSGERPFLWLQFSVQQPAPTSRTFHIPHFYAGLIVVSSGLSASSSSPSLSTKSRSALTRLYMRVMTVMSVCYLLLTLHPNPHNSEVG